MAVAWGALADMIIKAADNGQRGIENAATDDADVAKNSNPASTTVGTDTSSGSSGNKGVSEGYTPTKTETDTDTAVQAGKDAGEIIKTVAGDKLKGIGTGGAGDDNGGTSSANPTSQMTETVNDMMKSNQTDTKTKADGEESSETDED